MSIKSCLAALFVPLLILPVDSTVASSQHLVLRAGQAVTVFDSKLYPYRISYPSGWKYRAQNVGGLTVDAFFAPRMRQGFDDNINIFAERDSSGRSDAQLLALNIHAEQAQLGVRPQRMGTVTVGGHRVALITYNMPFSVGSRKLLLDVTQAMVNLKQHDWYFTLTTRKGDESSLQPVFESMLSTFHVR